MAQPVEAPAAAKSYGGRVAPASVAP